MDLKRILTTVIGIPIVILIIVFGNIYVLDGLLMAITVLCMYEYYTVIGNISHPIKWIGYLSTVIVGLVSILTVNQVMTAVTFSIPVITMILFLHVIISNMKKTLKDVAYTLLGIFYVTTFITFLSLIVGLENGKILLGYIVSIAWGTDIFAYLIGKRWGKHKFSKVSPKKSIEGCIAGIIGGIVLSLVYMFMVQLLMNKFNMGNILNVEVSTLYLYVGTGILSLLLSVISQVGDFTASSIKRFADIKDYGNLLPGHGGMLDRIDSLIFMAPFAYMFFTFVSSVL